MIDDENAQRIEQLRYIFHEDPAKTFDWKRMEKIPKDPFEIHMAIGNGDGTVTFSEYDFSGKKTPH